MGGGSGQVREIKEGILEKGTLDLNSIGQVGHNQKKKEAKVIHAEQHKGPTVKANMLDTRN